MATDYVWEIETVEDPVSGNVTEFVFGLKADDGTNTSYIATRFSGLPEVMDTDDVTVLNPEIVMPTQDVASYTKADVLALAEAVRLRFDFDLTLDADLVAQAGVSNTKTFDII